MKGKTPYNEQGQPHGYWECYYDNGQLWYKGKYINGKRDGYWKWYNMEGKLIKEEYYIN